MPRGLGFRVEGSGLKLQCLVFLPLGNPSLGFHVGSHDFVGRGHRALGLVHLKQPMYPIKSLCVYLFWGIFAYPKP